MQRTIGDEYFSDDDPTLSDSNYDRDKVVVLNSYRRTKYEIEEKGCEEKNQKELEKQIKLELEQEKNNRELEHDIEECYEELINYCKENALNLLDKCSFKNFYFFIKN